MTINNKYEKALHLPTNTFANINFNQNVVEMIEKIMKMADTSYIFLMAYSETPEEIKTTLNWNGYANEEIEEAQTFCWVYTQTEIYEIRNKIHKINKKRSTSTLSMNTVRKFDGNEKIIKKLKKQLTIRLNEFRKYTH